MLVRLGHAVLTQLGYDVTAYTSSVEALAAFQAAPHHFDLVITDYTMPQMTGDALSRALRRLRPDIPIILETGFSHTIDAEQAAALGIDAFLLKPWTVRELARTIAQVLAQRRVLLLGKDIFSSMEAHRDHIGLVGGAGRGRVRRQVARRGHQGMRRVRGRVGPGRQQPVLAHGRFQRLDGMEPGVLAQSAWPSVAIKRSGRHRSPGSAPPGSRPGSLAAGG